MKMLLSLALLSLISSQASFAQQSIEATFPFAQGEQEILNAQAWESAFFSDPKTIKDNAPFRFIAHAMLYGEYENSCASWACRYLENPSLISTSTKISMSVIDQDHPNFVTHWGLAVIVSVPIRTIGGTKSRDFGSGFVRDYDDAGEVLKTRSAMWPILTPEEVLSNTTMAMHNELVAKGTSIDGTEKVTITGVLVKCRSIPHHQFRNESMPEEEFRAQLRTCLDQFNGADVVIMDRISSLRTQGYPVLFLRYP